MVRYRELLESVGEEQIRSLLETYFKPIKSKIDIQNGVVNIGGHCQTKKGSRFATLPVIFGYIAGDFTCSVGILTSLTGSPHSVDRNFYCHLNNLTSLEGAPSKIGGGLYCYGNPLVSLAGLPKTFTEIFLSAALDLPLLRLVGRKVEFMGARGHNSTLDWEVWAAVPEILAKYEGEPTRANIVACQKELIDAGFAGNASW